MTALSTAALERNQAPCLPAPAMASNAGSAATIARSPQNMTIGALSGIAYRHFSAVLVFRGFSRVRGYRSSGSGCASTALCCGNRWWFSWR